MDSDPHSDLDDDWAPKVAPVPIVSDPRLREQFLALAIRPLRGEKAVRVAPKVPRSLALQAFRRLAIGPRETLLAVIAVSGRLAALTSQGVRQLVPFDDDDPLADPSGLERVMFVPYDEIVVDESATDPIVRLTEPRGPNFDGTIPLFDRSPLLRQALSDSAAPRLNLTKLGPSERIAVQRFLGTASRVWRSGTPPPPSPEVERQAETEWRRMEAFSDSIRELDLAAREFFNRFAPQRGRWGAPAVYVIAFLCVLVFIASLGWGLESVLERHAQFAPAMIGDGEWGRMGTAVFLHANLMHLAFNMIALVLIGRIVERLYGTYFLIWIYVLSGIGGGLASLWATWSEVAASVGASGAIMGLFGALSAYLLRRRRSVPYAIFRELGFWILNCLGLTLGLGFALSWSGAARVDNAAHLGGLVVGFVAGWLACPPIPGSWLRPMGPEPRGVWRDSPIGRSAAMLAIAALLAASTAMFASRLGSDDVFQSRQFLVKSEPIRAAMEPIFEASEGWAQAIAKNQAKPGDLGGEIQRAVLAIDERLRQTSRLSCGAELTCELKESLSASYRELRAALENLAEPVSLKSWSAHTQAADRRAAEFDRRLPQLAARLNLPLDRPGEGQGPADPDPAP